MGAARQDHDGRREPIFVPMALWHDSHCRAYIRGSDRVDYLAPSGRQSVTALCHWICNCILCVDNVHHLCAKIHVWNAQHFVRVCQGANRTGKKQRRHFAIESVGRVTCGQVTPRRSDHLTKMRLVDTPNFVKPIVHFFCTLLKRVHVIRFDGHVLFQ